MGVRGRVPAMVVVWLSHSWTRQVFYVLRGGSESAIPRRPLRVNMTCHTRVFSWRAVGVSVEQSIDFTRRRRRW